jgi:hypothetical protein
LTCAHPARLPRPLQALTGWRSLALAARPRVLWVAAHYLELPAMLEETWSCLLGCVEDTLLRVWRMEGDAHTRLLAASAREGLLFKRATILQLVGVLCAQMKGEGGGQQLSGCAC